MAEPAIRDDLRDAHDAAWVRLGSAGSWLTGAERAAIVAASREARTCNLCLERKQALSPNAASGSHDGADDSPLSAAMVDAVHRIATDPGRLSQSWYEGLGLEPTIYVELLAVTATAVGIDTFHRAVGVELRALPKPSDGEPSGREARGSLDHELAWVPTRKMPGAPNVARSISIVPDELRALVTLNKVEYVDPMALLDVHADPGRAITRPQMELVAARLSALQECFY